MVIRAEANILGPLSLTLSLPAGERDATPSAKKQRQVLAMLLARAGRFVPAAVLIDELWDEEPPKSATTVVQTYILSIRKIIAKEFDMSVTQVASSMLQTKNMGYLFSTQEISLDLRRYQSCIESARCAKESGNDHQAVLLFSNAEKIWTGPAFVDIEVGRLLASEKDQFECIFLANLELRIEAQLRLERYREAAIDLALWVSRFPYHERLYAYYMYALCLAGWRDKALGVFQLARKTLAAGLGLEPCIKLQRLHGDILSSSDDTVANRMRTEHGRYLTGLIPHTVTGLTSQVS